MDKLKQWVALTVVGALVIMAAGWFLLISPKRSNAASIRLQTVAQQSTNMGLQAKLDTLRAEAKGLPERQATLAAVAAKIPDNPALPSLIRALSTAASDAGVELVSLAPTQPTAVTTSTSSTSSTPMASAAGAAKSAAGAQTLSTAGVGSALTGTLMQIPVAINVVGGYFQVEQFFDRVEHLSRAMKVTGFAMAPGTSPLKVAPAGQTLAAAAPPSTLTTTINALVYMSAGRLVSAAATTPLPAK